MTAKVLVSACLLGQRVRYDGGASDPNSEILERWTAEGRIVAICPEVAGGLPVPRPPAEIEPQATALDVLQGAGTVNTAAGTDVSAAYVAGARAALALAEKHGIRIAVLKERSPSCGSAGVYDGTFSRTLTAGMGVTAELLSRHGVTVFGESRLQEADAAVTASD